MSDLSLDPDSAELPPPRRRAIRVLLFVMLLVSAAAGGFFATWSGALRLPAAWGGNAGGEEAHVTKDIAFIAIEPIRISLGPGGAGRHLRFAAQLEAEKHHAEEVAAMMPRILDVLNSYLRAVDPALIEDRGALTLLRSQMLRRIQMVTGEGRVRDLLIAEFVLN